jgi:hypothetical protein
MKIAILVAWILENHIVKTQTATQNSGCLKFSQSSSQECLVCDSLNGYVLQLGGCIRNQIPNCLLSYEPIMCRLCDYGYFLDGSFQCAKVPINTFAAIPGCNHYLTLDRCLVCDMNHYLRNQRCRPTTAKMIPDCTINADETRCNSCNLQLPLEGGHKCTFVPGKVANKNCMFFRSPLSCNACKPGFKKDRNAVLRSLDDPVLWRNLTMQLRFWKEFYFSIVLNAKTCMQEYQVANCEVLGHNKTCERCSKGFVLSPNKTLCFVMPQPPKDPTKRILNCYRFATDDYEQCKSCYEGYILEKNGTACVLLKEPIPNCILRNQRISTKCLFCRNDYYVDETKDLASEQCVKRKHYIINCEQFDRVTDKCLNCVKGTMFSGTPPNVRCQPVIANCEVFNTQTTVLTCELCLPGFYPDDFNIKCFDAQDSTQGCYRYGKNKICEECRQKYYLDSSIAKCFLHDSIRDCDVYSLFFRNWCDKCNSPAVNAEITHFCRQVESNRLVDNCLQYDSKAECVLCNESDDFILWKPKSSSPSCVKRTSCLELADDKAEVELCKVCDNAHILFQKICYKPNFKRCALPYANKVKSLRVKFLTQWPCQVCVNNQYFKVLPPARSQVCLESTALPNCLQSYIRTGDTISQAFCTRCHRNFTTFTVSGQCEPDGIFSLTTAPVSTSDSNANYALPTATLHKLTSYSSDLFGVLRSDSLKSGTSWKAVSMANNFSPASTTSHSSTGNLFAPNTFCYQFSEDLKDCLSCKFFFSSLYVASSWSELLSSANMKPHSRWINQSFRIPNSGFFVPKMEYEAKYTTSSPPVKACRTSAIPSNGMTTTFVAGNPKAVHAGQLMDTYLIGGTQYHVCKLGENSTALLNIRTSVSYKELTMTIGYKAITAANYPLDWGTRLTSVPTSVVEYGPTCKRVNVEFGVEGTNNCFRSMNRTNVMWSFEQMMFLNCQECLPGFILTMSFFQVRVFYEVSANDPKNDFVWVFNECLEPSTIRSTLQLYVKPIENCVYYNASIVTDRPYYFCKHCQPGHYPKESPIKYQCFMDQSKPFVERTNPQLSEDGCLIGQAECSKYKICNATCGSSGCGAGKRCSQNPLNNPPLCVNIQCTECPTGGSAFNCRNAVDNCPIDKMCVDGTCKPKCDCKNPASTICNSKTNYNCTPVLLGTKNGKNSFAEEYLFRTANSVITLTGESPSSCGCSAGSVCEFGVCVPLTHCPVCKQTEFCRGVLSPSGAHTFYCDTSPVCDTCLGTQFCQSSFDFLTGVSSPTGCGPSPQWTFPYTGATCLTCLPCFGCDADEVCANGVCLRKLTGVCFFTHDKTVPVYCNRGKECWYGQCLRPYKIRTSTVYDCATAAGEFCWKGKHYKPHCPFCPRDSFCSVVPGSTPPQYKCVKSEFCKALCTGTEWCHGFFNFTLTGREGVFSGCFPYPQFTIENPYDECVNCNKCSPECNSDETCVGTTCIPKLYSVCSFEINNKFPLVCGPGEVCSNSVCVKATAKNPLFVFPNDDPNTSLVIPKGVFANGVLYKWDDCLCARTSFCKATWVSSSSLWVHSCTTLPSNFKCEGTTFPQSEILPSDPQNSVLSSKCGQSPQYSPVAGVCPLGCPEGFTCAKSACMPLLIGVCSITKSIPVYCSMNQRCINSVCRETLQLGVGTYSSCGATAGQFCLNERAVSLGKCPICLNNEVCTFIQKIDDAVSEYKCVPNSECNCPKFQFCSSTFDAATKVTTKGPCMDFPQFTFQNDPVETSCASLKPDEVCVKGVALPKLYRLCGLLFQRTVPVVCKEHEVCLNGVCYLPKLNDLVGVGFNAGCGPGKLCPSQTASPVTLNQCPVCNKNQYCKVTKVASNSFTYACQKNLEVCQCSDTTYCHAKVDEALVGSVTLNIVVSSPIGCLPHPQFEITGLGSSAVTQCSPSCGTGRQCISGGCVDNLLRVCSFHKSSIPVFCGPNSLCVKDVCLGYLAWMGNTVTDSPCVKITEFWWKDHCPLLASCPVCHNNQRCELSSPITAGKLRFQCSTNVPTNCQDCSDETYCQGTTTGSGNTSTRSPACSVRMNFGNLPKNFNDACAAGADPCIKGDLEDECSYQMPVGPVDPDDSYPSSCQDGRLCVNRSSESVLNQCKVCGRKEFCKVTKATASPDTYTYECSAGAGCDDCEGTDFCFAELINNNLATFVAGGVVSRPRADSSTRCSPFPQFEFKGIPVTPPCSSCQSDQQCISGVCVNNLLKVCSFINNSIPKRCEDFEECIDNNCEMKTSEKVYQTEAIAYCPPPLEKACGWLFGSSVPLVCPPGQLCANHACYSVSASGQMAASGCPVNSLLINGYCYPLFHCPICDFGSYCDFTIDDSEVVRFECVKSTDCDTCGDNKQFCWVEVDGPVTQASHGLSSKACQTHPQLTHTLSSYTGPLLNAADCTVSCVSPSTCVNSVCVPSLVDYCYYTENNTIPVKCEVDEQCVQSQCVHKSTSIGTFTKLGSYDSGQINSFPKDCPERLTCTDNSFCLNSDKRCTKPYLAQTCVQGYLSVFENDFVSSLTATVSPSSPKKAKRCVPYAPCNACAPNEVCVAPYILNESASLVQNKVKYFFQHTYCVKTFWELSQPYQAPSVTAPTTNYLKCRGNSCDHSTHICAWKDVGLSSCSGTYKIEYTEEDTTTYTNNTSPVTDINFSTVRKQYKKDHSMYQSPDWELVSTTFVASGSFNSSDSRFSDISSRFSSTISLYVRTVTVSGNPTEQTQTCTFAICTQWSTRSTGYYFGCVLTSLEALYCVAKTDFTVESERVVTSSGGQFVTTFCPVGYTFNTTAQKCLKAPDDYLYPVNNGPQNEANGCDLGGIIYQNQCYYPRACPVCDHRSYCKVSQLDSINYTYLFSCVTDAAKCTCVEGKYCTNQATDPLASNPTPISCLDYPQLGFPGSTVNTYKEETCAPACTVSQVCVNGVCFPKMVDVCSWLLNNTVAVTCGFNETCVSGKCVKECYPRCEFGKYCDYLKQECVEHQIYDTPNSISECVKIENCGITSNYSRSLDRCDRCEDDFAFVAIDIVEGPEGSNPTSYNLNKTKCERVNTAYCVAAIDVNRLDPSKADTPSYECLECMPGYDLQTGLGCVTVNEGCLLNNSTGYCHTCTWDYENSKPLLMTDGVFPKGECLQITDETTFLGTREVKIDPQCMVYNYFIDDVAIWESNKPTPSHDSFDNPIPVITELDSGTYICYQCKDGYFLNQTNACLPKSIPSCSQYETTSQADSITCKVCDTYFFLSADKLACAKAPIPSTNPIPECEIYDPNQECIKCNQNYYVSKTGANEFGQKTYCFRNVTEVDTRCGVIDEPVFSNSQKIECVRCEKISGAFAYPFPLTSSLYACMRLAPRSNCLDYDDIFFNKTQSCTQCVASHYLDQFTAMCQPRSASKYPDSTCKKFNLRADECQERIDNSANSIAVTQQLPLLDAVILDAPPANQFDDVAFNYNGWIMGCQVYADPTTCHRCHPPRYLNDQGFDYNNKCLKSEVELPFCSKYVLSGGVVVCEECLPGFLFKNGACSLITAVNCLSIEKEDQCKDCPATYPVLKDGHCILDNDNPWCLIYEPSASATKFLCSTCLEGFYPNDKGICQQVKNPITNCLDHLFDGLCQKCEEGYVLQFDGKRCFLKPDWDPDCEEFIYAPECSLCEPGHFIRNDTCVKCVGIPENCAYCDPDDNKVCLLCKFGHQMTPDFKCEVNKDLPADQLDPLLYRKWYGYPKEPGFDDEEGGDANATKFESQNTFACGALLRGLVMVLTSLAITLMS